MTIPTSSVRDYRQEPALVAPTGAVSISFTVPGQPLPKQRARVPKSGRAHTPARTQEAENVVALMAVSAGAKRHGNPVRVVLRFFEKFRSYAPQLPRPHAWRKTAGKLLAVDKPIWLRIGAYQ